jgi:hypothetical protein
MLKSFKVKRRQKTLSKFEIVRSEYERWVDSTWLEFAFCEEAKAKLVTFHKVWCM